MVSINPILSIIQGANKTIHGVVKPGDGPDPAVALQNDYINYAGGDHSSAMVNKMYGDDAKELQYLETHSASDATIANVLGAMKAFGTSQGISDAQTASGIEGALAGTSSGGSADRLIALLTSLMDQALTGGNHNPNSSAAPQTGPGGDTAQI
jgi:hypothetical protein